MKEFIIDNWKLLVCVAIGLAEILVLIFKKRIKFDTTKEKILEVLPFCIKIAEELVGSGFGDEKLQIVLDFVKELCKLDNSYDDFIVNNVEKILLTPTKKG